MVETLVDGIQKEITRVRRLQGLYKVIVTMPHSHPFNAVTVKLMEDAIQRGIKVLAEGDAIEGLKVYEELKSFEE